MEVVSLPRNEGETEVRVEAEATKEVEKINLSLLIQVSLNRMRV